MRMGNIRSSIMNTPSSMSQSGMSGVGDIWGDLLDAAVTTESLNTQKAIADASAKKAQAEADLARSLAQQEAAKSWLPNISPTVLMIAAAGLGGLLLLRRRAR